MTTLLEQAFTEAAKLPPQEQDAIATWLIDELASEHRWAQLFARSEHTLAQLANEALSEYRAGLAHKLDTDRL